MLTSSESFPIVLGKQCLTSEHSHFFSSLVSLVGSGHSGVERGHNKWAQEELGLTTKPGYWLSHSLFPFPILSSTCLSKVLCACHVLRILWAAQQIAALERLVLSSLSCCSVFSSFSPSFSSSPSHCSTSPLPRTPTAPNSLLSLSFVSPLSPSLRVL